MLYLYTEIMVMKTYYMYKTKYNSNRISIWFDPRL